jgi:hypothetical protein
MGADKEEKEAPVRVLDADDIALLKSYGVGPYAAKVSQRRWALSPPRDLRGLCSSVLLQNLGPSQSPL